jgi:hypothetical protein
VTNPISPSNTMSSGRNPWYRPNETAFITPQPIP